jgi:DNA-binding response OmpR family regulator
MKRILVIDDDPAVRLLYEEELLEEGYEVISSDGGNGALRLIAEQKPDLVLLDLKLGDRSGLDLLQDIRKNSWSVPVVLLTAYPTFKLDSKSVSVHAHVTKKSDLRELKRQIEKSFSTPDSRSGSGRISGKDRHAASVKPALQLGMRFHD